MTTAIFESGSITNNTTLSSSWRGETKRLNASICTDSNNKNGGIAGQELSNNSILKDGYIKMLKPYNGNQMDLNNNTNNDNKGVPNSDEVQQKTQQQIPIPSKPTQGFVLANKYLVLCGPNSTSNNNGGITASKTVYECRDKSGGQFTCKVVPRNQGLAMLAAYHRLESDSSSFVNQAVEAIMTPKMVYFIMPKNYGNVYSYLLAKGKLKEAEAANIFKQMVSALQYCHSKGVILRDIKMGKFVFVDKARSIVKLESLEDAVLLVDPNDDNLDDKHGCPNYVSPEKAEMLRSSNAKYSGKATDVWSLGIILYTMLVGRYPFNDATCVKLMQKIRTGSFIIPQGVSSSATSLVKALLRKSPLERPTCKDILKHSWFTHHCVPNSPTLQGYCGIWRSEEITEAPRSILISSPDQVVPDL